MYLAVRELNIGPGRRVAPGQPVPEAETWEVHILRAHLNQHLIEWIDECIPNETKSISPERDRKKNKKQSSHDAK